MVDAAPFTTAAEALAHARRIVVKLGSALIAPEAPGTGANLSAIAEESAQRPGPEVVLVSSGAVALGRARHPGLPADGMAARQALSALGQPLLMKAWEAAFAPTGRMVAQVLLTPDITEDRRRYLHARATLRSLLEGGAVPIINENDAVATDELRYGDNDRLAAMTAGLIGADLLVLLTDIDGLYTANPKTHPGAEPIPLAGPDILARLDRQDLSRGTSVGTGGMASKLDAAKWAAQAGIPTIIGSGREARPLSAMASGSARATLIPAARTPMPARRRWLAGLALPDGALTVDAGAAQALRDGKSLLAVGILSVDRAFSEGDSVAVRDTEGQRVGLGLARMPSGRLDRQARRPIIHRDDFILEDDT